MSLQSLINVSGDAEINPGLKLILLKAYIILHKFDIICLSETYLNSTTPTDDDKLHLRYTFIRCNHPSNAERGGVCIYHRSSLPLRVLNIGYLHECLSF